MLHVKIKPYIFLLFVLLHVTTKAQNTCLLEEPLTDQCLNSVSTSTLEKELTPYLCVIATERSLLPKAQQFCKQAYLLDAESGYRYLKVLLGLRKFQKAFQTQYALFFSNPFVHNNKVMAIINESQIIFKDISSNHQKYTELTDFDKAIFYFYNNQVDKSLSSLTKYIQKEKENKTFVYEHFLMARIFEVQFKYYQGMNYLKELLKTNNVNHGYLWHINGNFLMHHVQFEKAIKSFEMANKWFDQSYGSKGFSFTDYNIGLCYQKLSKVEQAIKYYEKSIIKLSSAQALNALGHAHFTLYEKNNDSKKLDLAQKYYKKSLEVNPEYTVVLFNLGMLQLARKKLSSAEKYFQECVAASSAFPSCKYGLFKTFYYLNQTSKADLIISTMQLNQQTLAELAAILYQLGDHKKALSLIGQKEDLKFSQVFQWKGFNQYELGLYEKAEKSFQKAIYLGAKKGYIYYSLGLSELQLKKYEECSRSFDTAYKMDAEKLAKAKRDECKKLMESDL